MHVLCLTPELPYPSGGGGSTRQYHLLRRLVELGHEVTVVAPVAASQRSETQALPAVGVRLHDHRRPASRVGEVLVAIARRPPLALEAMTRPLLGWQVEVFWTRLRSTARTVIERARPDVICIEHDNAISWAGDLDPSIPAVITFHNVSWSYYAARARAAGGVRGLALGREAGRFKRYDLRHLSRYRSAIAVSERDRDELLRASPARVELVPNGVDSRCFSPREEEAGDPVVLFTGTMSHPPNAQGIRWFVERVWPGVAASLPRARLAIVGRNPPSAVRRLADDRIEVTGAVSSTVPYFARSRLAIVPLHSGGGTRLKLLEALAAGRAVVSTSVGAEGIDVTDGQDALIADDADGFAAAILQTLTDDAVRHRIASAGRRLAERYDWRLLGDRFEQILLDAVDREPRPPAS